MLPTLNRVLISFFHIYLMSTSDMGGANQVKIMYHNIIGSEN